jgi:hypothetical protein
MQAPLCTAENPTDDDRSLNQVLATIDELQNQCLALAEDTVTRMQQVDKIQEALSDQLLALDEVILQRIAAMTIRTVEAPEQEAA